MVSRLAERDRVLVVDDDEVIRGLVRDGLEREGFDVSDVADGSAALERLAGDRPSIVILDVNLPTRGGFEVLSAIREGSNVPVILLTGRVSEIDRVLGLELGADDYVVKPFSPRELAAHVRAVLRRSVGDPERPLTFGELEIDPAAREMRRGGELVELTGTRVRSARIPHAIAAPCLLARRAARRGLALGERVAGSGHRHRARPAHPGEDRAGP